ncbi:MAG: acyloxyacyl hydrolase [Parachlamydiales bacterium]|nr:acyloxyacyl hydrolase [Parachlamydiales bacterium]
MKKLFFFALMVPFVLVGKEKVNLLSYGIGIYNALRTHQRTGEMRLEFKSRYEFATFRPMVGIMSTFQGSIYAYGGFGLDWIFKDHLVLSPDFAAGYFHKGGGKDLGCKWEFRSGIEVGWQWKNLSRCGLHFYHISNANLGHKNPGEESFVLFYAIPIKGL